MIDVTEWQEGILDAVTGSDGVSSTFPRGEMESVDGLDRFVEVEFEEAINTFRILEKVSSEVADHTTVVVRVECGTVQFRFEECGVSGVVEGSALIHKILSEDVPVRRGFVPEYEIHDGFVMVESPVERPVELFESMRTRLWNLTGVYERDGLYRHRFEQLARGGDDGDVIEKYGRFRLQNILWGVSVPCPECGGEVKYHPSSVSGEWFWECDGCLESWGSSEPTEIIGRVAPLWNRQRIIEEFYKAGLNTVHSG